MADCRVFVTFDKVDLLLLLGLVVYAVYIWLRKKYAPYLPVSSKNIYDGSIRMSLKRASEFLASFFLYAPFSILAGALAWHQLANCVDHLSGGMLFLAFLTVVLIATVAATVIFPVYRKPGG